MSVRSTICKSISICKFFERRNSNLIRINYLRNFKIPLKLNIVRYKYELFKSRECKVDRDLPLEVTEQFNKHPRYLSNQMLNV